MRESDSETPEEIDVKLKPFLGLPPTTYLPVIYGVAVLVILFLLLILPGLSRPGTILTVETTPPHAAVAIDTVIRGSSGEPIFVPFGTRSLDVSKPGFQSQTQTLESGRRVVGSLFFPRRLTLDVSLDPIAPGVLVENALLEFSAWSLVGEASGQYQLPPIARNLARDLAGAGRTELYDDFLDQALLHVDSEAQLNDLLAGALLASADGVPPGPIAITAVMQDFASRATQSPAIVAQFAGFFTGIRREIVVESEWMEAATVHLANQSEVSRVEPSTTRAPVRNYGGMVFVQVPAGEGLVGGTPRAERGGDISYAIATPGFLVSQTEVTVQSFERFVQAVPEWAPANASMLVSQGLVDDDYLRDWSDGTPTATLPVRDVSAYAAEAFAEWFSTQVDGSGLTARLPTEAEWDYLAALEAPQDGVFALEDATGPAVVGESVRGSLGLLGLAGNVWEWSSDPFATYDRYHPQADRGMPADSTAHRVVRGGGWATPGSDFLMDDRGSLPPSWCSGAVGFRIVLAER